MTRIEGAIGLPADRLRRVLLAAGRAPSLHNTQPWRFRLTDSAIELYADPDRALAATDPDGVELRLACGAALFNLRVALAAAGVRPVVHRFPGGAVLAEVRSGGVRPATPEDVRLAQAIPQRRTNRRPFTTETVSGAQCHELIRAAHREAAALHVVRDRDQRSELGRLSERAHRRQLADRAVQSEFAAWTARRDDAVDGVPTRAGGPPPGPRDRWTLRAFSGDERPSPLAYAGFEGEPLIAVLTAHAAGRMGDLRAGEALQRVLLTATAQGLAVSPVSQLVEVSDIRAAVGAVVRAARPPHAVLRIGYGWPVVGSPRRPVEDLVLAEPADPPDPAPGGRVLDPHDRSRLW